MRFRTRFLSDILGIFTMAKDTERDAERQPGGLREPRLELAFEIVIGPGSRQKAVRELSDAGPHALIIRPSLTQDAAVFVLVGRGHDGQSRFAE